MKQTSKARMYSLALCGVLSAISAVLQFLEFPLPFIIPSFIKFDFSDLPALLAAFSIGPVYGAAVCLIKNLIHLTVTATGGVGELANFLVGACFVLPAGIAYSFLHSKKGAVIGSVAGSVLAAVISFPVNYFITYPFYQNFMPIDDILAAYNGIFGGSFTLVGALLSFNLPFTLVKCLLVSLIVIIIYKPLSPLFHRFTRK